MRLLFCVVSLLITLSSPLAATTLQTRITEAKTGDYIVAAQDKSYTLIHVASRTGKNILVEEITVPQNAVCIAPGVWDEWLNSNAPGYTSWLLYEMDVTQCEVAELYDVAQKRWIPLTEGDHLLATLLRMELSPQPDHLRRKIGPSPLPGELDRRRFWNPPLYFNGSRVPNAKLSSWKGYWPADGTELAGKAVILYLPNDEYLTFFPYWIEIAGGIARAKLRIKDSGRGLTGPITALPLKS